jgi:hypothetical protein
MNPAWMCLPPAVLSVLLGSIVMPAQARAYPTTPHTWGQCVTLRLTDGRMVAGCWHGDLGSPYHPTDYAERYERWRGPWGSFTAPALGESLLVSRTTGAPVIGEFRGFAGRALLIATPDSCAHLMVMLDEVQDVRRAFDPATEAEWSAAREHWSDAPSLDGVALQSGPTMLAIPAAAIAGDCAQPVASGGSAAGAIMLGVLAAGVVAYLVSGAVVASAFGGLFNGLARIGQ